MKVLYGLREFHASVKCGDKFDSGISGLEGKLNKVLYRPLRFIVVFLI
jgi:hypothetical protein